MRSLLQTVLVEATSGNTGVSLAYQAAARGYKLILTMPYFCSLERRVVQKVGGQGGLALQGRSRTCTWAGARSSC